MWCIIGDATLHHAAARRSTQKNVNENICRNGCGRMPSNLQLNCSFVHRRRVETMDIGLVAVGQPLGHSAPAGRPALVDAAAMADGRARSSSFAAQHPLMHPPIAPFVVAHPAANIPMPDQMAVVC